MMSVFIGGSRAMSKLDEPIRKQLDNFIDRNCEVLIGDANGSDKAVQKYFAEQEYRKVTVFCMAECRNNVGQWPTRIISSERKPRDFEYFATKDAAMAKEAKCGLMLWDGKSRGTLNNVLSLLRLGKPVLIYLGPQKEFYRLSNDVSLINLLAHCDRQVVDGLITQLDSALAARVMKSLPTLGESEGKMQVTHPHDRGARNEAPGSASFEWERDTFRGTGSVSKVEENGAILKIGAEISQPCDLFRVFWEAMREFMIQPKTEREIASAFHLEAVQVRKWMARAVEEKRVRRTGRPVRYQLSDPTAGATASLFSSEQLR